MRRMLRQQLHAVSNVLILNCFKKSWLWHFIIKTVPFTGNLVIGNLVIMTIIIISQVALRPALL